jgi:REP element-mobilizing transposase RayT
MGRPRRSFEPGGFYHLTAKGNNDGPIVIDDIDRSRYVRLLTQVSRRYGLDIHVWCLMTNHYHLVVQTRSGEVSRAIQQLNCAHARGFNLRHERTGHLFLAHFRATTILDELHYARAREYVLDNPVRAGIVPRREDWPWCGAVGARS